MVTTRICLFFIFGIILLTYNLLYSQNISEFRHNYYYVLTPDSGNVPQFLGEEKYPWHGFITNLPDDWRSFGIATVSNDKLNLLLGTGAATGLLLFIDDDWHKQTKQKILSSPLLKNTTDITVHLGDGKTSLALAGGMTLYGLVAGEKKYINTSIKVVESLLASGITVQLLKRLTGRESPAVSTEKGGMWRFFPSWKLYQKNQRKYYAFPSGHITTITSTMTVLCNSFPDAKYLKPLSYGVIALTGIGLIQKDMHWYSDFPLALFLGYSFGNIIAPSADYSWLSRNSEIKLTIMNNPINRDDFAPGINLGWHF